MKTIARKPLMIKINKLRLRNLDNKHLKKAGEHIDRNVVEITIKMKIIAGKPLMIKNDVIVFDANQSVRRKEMFHVKRQGLNSK